MKNNLIKIIKLIAPFKWWMILATFIGFLTIGSGIGLLMTSAYIIAKAALHPDIGQLQVGIVGVRFFGITRGLFRYAERLVSHNVTFSLLAKFRVWFFKSIEPLFPSKTVDFTSGDLLTRVVSDVESLEHIFIRVIAPPVIAVFIALIMLILFLNFSLSILLPFIIPYLIAGVIVPFLTHKLSRKDGEKYIRLRSRLTEITLDGIDGKNELLSFGLIKNHEEEFNKVNSEILKIEKRMKLIEGMNESLIGLMMNIAVITVFIESANLTIANEIAGVSISVIVLGTMAAFEALFPIPVAIQHLKSSLMASKRVFQITDKEVVENSTNKKGIIGENIEFKDVVFSYNKNKNVLKNISVSIEQKKKVAIIGGSGEGKSSVINLLLKFWEQDSGEILMNGISFKELSQTEIIENISVIPQKVFLFSNTVKENLLIANPNASEEELWEALKDAEMDKFVEQLPQKMDTWIGNQGKELSGGERKRIGIARSILKNRNIVVCDEITADLDSVNEEKIINTILRTSNNKALLYITHRLVDLEKFDIVYLFEHGEIVASGLHKELIKASPEYQKYFL